MLDNDTIRGQLISRRTFIIGAGKLGLLFLLAGRMFYMQFIKKDEYKTLSDKNRIKMIIIAPARGQIYDRNMKLIAKNNTCFRLLLDKNISNNFSKEIKLIAKFLELDEKQIKEVTKRAKFGTRRIASIIIDCLSWEQVSAIEEQKETLKSIFVDTGYIRFYKYSDSLTHLLGYMGKISKDEQISHRSVDSSFRVGKNGIEKFYEAKLRGDFGHKQIEVNAHGSYIREVLSQPSVAGSDLQLNIDADLQEYVLSCLDVRGSSAIVMDCEDGSILNLSSSPSYDANKFYILSNEYWSSLIKNPYKPLLNKAVCSLYAPGSIFKLITILAALEARIDPTYKVYCDGSSIIGTNSFRCASRRGHGFLDMQNAIKYSCNIYIYQIAKMIGPEIIINTAKKFGFGQVTNIDFPSELKGFVPNLEWKLKKTKSKWSLGDTFNLAIGQGFLLSTPLQLARFITAIASDGKLFTPKIVKSPSKYSQVEIDKDHLNFLKTSLYKTINNIGGTGYSGRLRYNDIKMAGKTGTAQVVAKKNRTDDLSKTNVAWYRRNHSIFTGYAPYDKPKYSVTVYYDHGGDGGRSAAPIAKKIMEKVFG